MPRSVLEFESENSILTPNFFAAAPAKAAASEGAPAKTVQQSKRASGNKDAAGKKGDERKAFMKAWLIQ